MAEAPACSLCPPHHWRITAIRIDHAPYDHYECLRCAAMKDVPQLLDRAMGAVWPRAGRKHKPVAPVAPVVKE